MTSIRVEGVTIDTRELDRIVSSSSFSAQQVINRLAYQVERQAKKLCPVDTGALRASIYTNTPGHSGFTGSILRTVKRGERHASVLSRQAEALPMPDGIAAIVGSPMGYAAYVELGTSRMDAHPYLTPAVESIVGKFNSGDTWKELVGK